MVSHATSNNYCKIEDYTENIKLEFGDKIDVQLNLSNLEMT